MTKLDDLETKALDLAKESSDADYLLKASQALSAIRQIKEYKRTPTWPNVLAPITTLVAVIIAALTFYNQTQESKAHTEAAEDSQWTDVMRQISLKDSSIDTGIFGVQSFFDSKRHGVQAREVATALLPLVGNKDAFEIVAKGLVRHTDGGNQRDLIVIARAASENAWDLFHALDANKVPGKCPSKDVIAFLNGGGECYGYKEGEESPLAKRAWLYSWEIDSMSDYLVKLWQMRLPNLTPAGMNLSGIFLVNGKNLSNLDFQKSKFHGAVIHLCDISGAHFDHADLRDVTLHQVENFKDSTWTDANWWEARSISCSLATELKKSYWPADANKQQQADSIVAGCTSDE
jgi:Pentapeptide repeats (8 copies)